MDALNIAISSFLVQMHFSIFWDISLFNCGLSQYHLEHQMSKVDD